SGEASESQLIRGALHSVNPTALLHVPEVFLLNERRLCRMHSDNFGESIIMEIGALGVGSIHQSYGAGSRVQKGQEKGYFSFGGSTSLLLVKEATLEPLEEILEKNKEGYEVLVRLGETIAQKITKKGT